MQKKMLSALLLTAALCGSGCVTDDEMYHLGRIMGAQTNNPEALAAGALALAVVGSQIEAANQQNQMAGQNTYAQNPNYQANTYANSPNYQANAQAFPVNQQSVPVKLQEGKAKSGGTKGKRRK